MINLCIPFQLACFDPIPNFLEEYENKYDPDESDDKKTKNDMYFGQEEFYKDAYYDQNGEIC